jgi:hypothetical protein
MEKSKIATAAIVIILVVSIVIGAQEFAVFAKNKVQQDKLNLEAQFASDLDKMKLQVTGELSKLNQSLLSAANQLSTTDLQGQEANSILTQLSASNSYIVNSVTCDANDVILAVQPSSQYSSIIGENISDQEQNIVMHKTLKPAMSNMIRLVEGFNGVVMVVPIFDSQGTLKGSISIVIQPSQIFKDAATSQLSSTAFRSWAIQTNGTIIYDKNATKIGTTLIFTSIRIGNFTISSNQIVRLIERNATGSREYFVLTQGTALGFFVQEQVTWTSVGMYDKSWRLAIVRVISD